MQNSIYEALRVASVTFVPGLIMITITMLNKKTDWSRDIDEQREIKTGNK